MSRTFCDLKSNSLKSRARLKWMITVTGQVVPQERQVEGWQCFNVTGVLIINPPLSVRDLKFLARGSYYLQNFSESWVWGSYYLQNFDPVLDHFLTVSPFKSAKKVQKIFGLRPADFPILNISLLLFTKFPEFLTWGSY